MSHGGVPVDMLRCPTCSVHFLDYNLYSDPVDFNLQVLHTQPVIATARTPWYILCPNGHKWTVKTIWRAMEDPDEVLLGEYLGEVP